jgi:FkbM family methyltransferase
MRLSNTLEHTFLPEIFRSNPIVLDLGGNKGEFAKFMTTNFAARVFLLEPLPRLFRDIEGMPGLVKYEEALSANSGNITLHDAPDRCATAYGGYSQGEEVTVKSVDLAELMGRLPAGDVDLVKMDIEGAEIEVLETAAPEVIRRARQITVEFHDFLYPELTPRVEAIKSRLSGMGFYVINFSYHTNGDVLFVRKDAISRLHYFWLKYLVKYYRGIRRVAARI